MKMKSYQTEDHYLKLAEDQKRRVNDAERLLAAHREELLRLQDCLEKSRHIV